MEFKSLNRLTAWVIGLALVLALGLAWLRSV
jgi:preprotein translocase subunit SecG